MGWPILDLFSYLLSGGPIFGKCPKTEFKPWAYYWCLLFFKIVVMLDAGNRQQMENIVSKAIKQGFLPADHIGLAATCDQADMTLFSAILKNSNHVLHQFLPPIKATNYDLRARVHNRTIPMVKDTLLRKTFIIRMIYKDFILTLTFAWSTFT